MTEYNFAYRCEKHQSTYEMQHCLWCEIDGLKREVRELKLEITKLLKKEGGDAYVPRSLWIGTHDRR